MAATSDAVPRGVIEVGQQLLIACDGVTTPAGSDAYLRGTVLSITRRGVRVSTIIGAWTMTKDEADEAAEWWTSCGYDASHYSFAGNDRMAVPEPWSSRADACVHLVAHHSGRAGRRPGYPATR